LLRCLGFGRGSRDDLFWRRGGRRERRERGEGGHGLPGFLEFGEMLLGDTL
jgi:hypothetical protein